MTWPRGGAPANQGFVLHLRPDNVVGALHHPGLQPDRDEVQTLLAQLVDWDNLPADADTIEVATAEEFVPAHHLTAVVR